VFSQRGEGWVEKRLSEVCLKKRVITYGVIKLGPIFDGGVPCLRTSNVRWLTIDTNGIKMISPSLSAEYSRTILQGGEILVNVRGTLGGVATVNSVMKGWNVSREVAVVPIDNSCLYPEYGAYWIGSYSSQNWLTGVKKGAAYTGINIEDLRNLPISVPPLVTQRQIVALLKGSREETQHLESIYQKKITALDELKQSLLHQAFNGDL
jgi:type I restriction enzyme S subunit